MSMFHKTLIKKKNLLAVAYRQQIADPQSS